MIRAWVFLFLSLSVSVFADVPRRCDLFLLTRTQQTEAIAAYKTLIEMGYADKVIDHFSPKDWAALANSRARPLTLYRGVKVPPNKFLFYGHSGSDEHHSVGVTWYALHAEKADTYASPVSTSQKYGTVIEIQAPEIWYEPYGDSKRYPYGSIENSTLGNVEPFVIRVGVQEAFGETVWFTKEEADKMGLFEKGFKYSTLFKKTLKKKKEN